MGDLRNKFRKIERDEAHREFMAKRYPIMPPPPPIRCQCGLTPAEVPAMWAVHRKRSELVKFYCPACIPPNLLDACDSVRTV